MYKNYTALILCILLGNANARVLIFGDSHLGTHGGRKLDALIRKEYSNSEVYGLSFCGTSSYSFTGGSGRMGAMTCGLVQIYMKNSPPLIKQELLDPKVKSNQSYHPDTVVSYSAQYRQRSAGGNYTYGFEGAPKLKTFLQKNGPIEALFLSIGTNEYKSDRWTLAFNYKKLARAIPKDVPCYILGMPYFGKNNNNLNGHVDQVYKYAYAQLEAVGCKILDGRDKSHLSISFSEYHTRDGIHLKNKFYEQWALRLFHQI